MTSLWRQMRRRLGHVRRLLTSLSRAELLEAVRVATESEAARQARLSRIRARGAGRIVFVCHGNIMRSAFAGAYVRRTSPGLAHRVSSAGTHGTDGWPAETGAQRVALELDVDLTEHAATSLQAAAPQSSDVLICMDLANAARVRLWAGVERQLVFLIGDVLDAHRLGDRIVHDPYGRGEAATREAFLRVRLACDRWASLLAQ